MPTNSQNETSDIRQIGYEPPPDVGPVELQRLSELVAAAAPGEFVGTQRLGFDLLLHIESGHAHHEVDFTKYLLHPGDALWVHTGQIHRWGTIDAIDGRLLMVNADALQPTTQATLRGLGALSRVHWPAATLADAPISHILDALAACAMTDADPSAAAMRDASVAHLTSALLLQLAGADSGSAAPRSPVTERIAQFHADIDAHFATDRTVDSYARRLHCSSRTLNRLVREQTGSSPKDLIDHRVALEARRRLAHEDTPIAAIARSLGFDDAANFTKFFRRCVGETPQHFRDAYRR